MIDIIICVRQLGGLKFTLPFIEKNYKRVLIILPDALIKIIKEKKLKLNFLSSKKCKYDYLKKKFANNSFKKLLISACYVSKNEVKFERECLKFARFKNLEVIQFFDASYGYLKRIHQTNGDKVIPDKILVMDNKSKSDLVKLNIDSKKIFVVGNPYYETIKKVEKGFDETLLLFISQPIKKDLRSELGYTERDIWEEIKAILMLKQSSIKKIFYKPHPRENLNSDFFKKIKSITYDDKQVDSFNGTIIGVFSSKMIELFLQGRNIISFQKNKSKNYCFLSSRNYIGKISKIEEIDDKIKNFKTFKNKNIENIFKKSLRNIENILL